MATFRDSSGAAPALSRRSSGAAPALSVHPKLWNSMCIIGFEDKDEEGAYVDFCRTWLSRAGNLPISLALVDDIVHGISPDPEDSVLSVILEWAGRLRALEIGGRFWGDILNGEKGSITERVPLLEELTISTYNELGSVVLPDAPKLRIVSVALWAPMQLPWHQLTKIHIGYIDIVPFLAILQTSTSLLQASFDFYAWTIQSSRLPVSDYSHARLRRIHLGVAECSEKQIPLSLLHHLKTPTLEGLSVAFLHESLTLDLSPLLPIKCLKLTPSLTHLRLTPHYIRDIDVLFTQLTGRPEFLPRLENLEMELSNAESYRPTTSVVVEMLCWRWAAAGITQLQSFRLRDPISGSLLYAGENITPGDDVFWDF
ncbi:hypothetical protein C8R46DRAFT_1119022 [Mycena filopes]|nr:hypothetical protein C8R46DRAFT_1119022 [Mycena filopes]